MQESKVGFGIPAPSSVTCQIELLLLPCRLGGGVQGRGGRGAAGQGRRRGGGRGGGGGRGIAAGVRLVRHRDVILRGREAVLKCALIAELLRSPWWSASSAGFPDWFFYLLGSLWVVIHSDMKMNPAESRNGKKYDPSQWERFSISFMDKVMLRCRRANRYFSDLHPECTEGGFRLVAPFFHKILTLSAIDQNIIGMWSFVISSMKNVKKN